ncbi:MAG TPA: gamma-glutamyl phosphate reductase, partial [Actinomycetota bacterium]
MKEEISRLVGEAAAQARWATGDMARATDGQIENALGAIAGRLTSEAAALLAANKEDMDGAHTTLSSGGLDRLRLDEIRLAGIARQVRALAALPPLERIAGHRMLDNGLELEERR